MNYLNTKISIILFEQIIKSRFYVDKSMMIEEICKTIRSDGKYICITRPRRFGKTVNANMLAAYFVKAANSEEEVNKLCQKQDKICFEEIKQWYDGYYLSDGRSLFNPRSVSRALSRGVCLNYWTETGPMNEIADCVEHNVDEVRADVVHLVSGIPVEAELDGYSAAELQLDSRNEILSAMVVYGFLAYYDGYLTIPNSGLMEKFQRVLSRDSMGEISSFGCD